MVDFPPLPFLTDDFSPAGKGIDYLGMRNVNLIFLESELISGINNATRDLGTYVLGVWIAWKFAAQLTESSRANYTRDNFIKFSQAIEVAISYATRDGSTVNNNYPVPRNRIGKNQIPDLSKKLIFNNMTRGASASIFNAAQYGPSLRWVGLTADAKSEDGGSAGFQMAVDDASTKVICEYVDSKLRQSPFYDKLLLGDGTLLTAEEIDELGMKGLCAGFYHRPEGILKQALEIKLFPVGSTRKSTADLIVTTLKKYGPLSEEDLRRVWYTGLTPSGEKFILDSPELMQHAGKWGIFYSRQIVRYALESLLCCLERAVDRGCGTIEEVVDTFLIEWMESGENYSIESFSDLLTYICKKADLRDNEQPEYIWCNKIGPQHEHFEFIKFDEGLDIFSNAMIMLAGWWLRLSGNLTLKESIGILPDESGRIPMQELYEWLSERIEGDFIYTCNDLMTEFVYSQHLRIGMSRLGLDGTRLRFSLGDNGISPTAKLENFARVEPPLMADRLHALINLMEDLSYVDRDGDLISAL